MFGTLVLEGVDSKAALLAAKHLRDEEAILVMGALVASIGNLQSKNTVHVPRKGIEDVRSEGTLAVHILCHVGSHKG